MRESPTRSQKCKACQHFIVSLFSNTKLIHQKTTTNMLLHNVLLLSVCQYTSGFTTAPSSSAARLAPLKNGYLDSINAENNDNNGDNNGEPPQPAVREAPSTMIDLDITDGRQSNLSFRDNRNWASVNDDPRPFDVNSRSVYSCFVFVGTSLWQFYDVSMPSVFIRVLLFSLTICKKYITMKTKKLLHRDLDASLNTTDMTITFLSE